MEKFDLPMLLKSQETLIQLKQNVFMTINDIKK